MSKILFLNETDRNASYKTEYRYIGRIERDKCNPSIVTVEQLEKAFHLPPMSLVRLKLNPEIQLFSDSEEGKCVGYACKKLEYSLVANLTKTDMLKACDVIRE